MQKESKRPFRIHQGLQGGRIHKHLAQELAVHRVLFDFYGLFFLAREFLVLRKITLREKVGQENWLLSAEPCFHNTHDTPPLQLWQPG